ncbi:uncharacterized protein LOC107849189 [Capsicum annuum]|uniref:uncharacterized protein LOC107849189 n=1 Tax=Capsicum annuum TaxID=4072 RepID=UPI0007BEB8CD|nr:uncharacterized protein LOC107849189 [Capsicum annuum]
MPKYAKFMKDLISKKRLVEDDTIEITHHCSAIMSSTLSKKKNNPGAFIIPCTIGLFRFPNALCDLRASVNLMPYAIFHKLKLTKPQPTMMELIMADRSIKKPIKVLHDFLIKVDWFIFLADFVILDCAMAIKISIILGRPLLATGKALVNVESGEIKFWFYNKVSFNVFKSMKKMMDLQVISIIDVINGEVTNHVKVSLLDDPFVGMLWNCKRKEVEEFDEVVTFLMGLGSYTKNPVKLNLDLKNHESPSAKPSILEPSTIKLKPLPPHLKRMLLGDRDTLPTIIASDLDPCQVEALKLVVKRFISAIG